MKKSLSLLLTALFCIASAAAFPILNVPNSTVGQLAGILFTLESASVLKIGLVINSESAEPAVFMNSTYHDLAAGNFSQNWSNRGLITTADDWSAVPSIIGYRGDALSNSTATDPQTVLAPSAVVNVIPQSSTGTGTGGVHEIEAAEMIALQGSGTADAPYIVLHLDSVGRKNITVTYSLV